MSGSGRCLIRLARLAGFNARGTGWLPVVKNGSEGGSAAVVVGGRALPSFGHCCALLWEPPPTATRSAMWTVRTASAHSSALNYAGGTGMGRDRGQGALSPVVRGTGTRTRDIETTGENVETSKAPPWQHGRKSMRHHHATKRQHVALNKRLMAARDLGSLMDVSESDGLTALSPLNVDTLLARLLRVRAYQGPGKVTGPRAGRVQALLVRVSDYMASGLGGYPTVTLTSCVDRLIRLNLTPLPIDLQKSIEQELVRRPRDFTAPELAKLCGFGVAAFSVAHVLPAFVEMERRVTSASLPLDSLISVASAFTAVSYHSPAVLDALERRLAKDLSSLDGAQLAAAMTELAAFPDRSPELFDDLTARVVSRAHELKPAHLADAAHAAVLARCSAPAMLDAIKREMTPPRLYALGPERLVHLSCALVSSSSLSSDMAATVEKCAIKRLDQFGGADLGRLLWCLGVSRGVAIKDFLGEVEPRLVERMGDLDSNTLAGAAWACAQSGHSSRALIDALDDRAATLFTSEEVDPNANSSVELSTFMKSLQAMASDEDAGRLRMLQRWAGPSSETDTSVSAD